MHKSIFYSTRIPNLTLSILGGVTVLLVLFAGLHIGNLQAARSASPDPEITQITITHSNSINLYDPAPGTGISRTVYFSATRASTGSCHLDYVNHWDSPTYLYGWGRFDQNAVRTVTSTTAPWEQPVTYTVSGGDGDQPNVPYVVTNTHQASYQVNLSFIKDAIPPTAVITSPLTSPATTFPVSWNGNDAGSGVASYDIDYKENNGPWQSWLTGVTTTTAVFAGQREITYTLRVKANDNVGNPPSYATSVTFIERAKVYLPFVSSSIPVPQVTWTPSPRSMGITTFVRPVNLILAASPTPTHMRVWQENSEPSDWVPFVSSYEFTLTGDNGLKNINVRFKWDTVESVISTISVFLLENGDFYVSDLNGTGWSTLDGGLPEVIGNNNLRLGADYYNCYNGVPPNEFARAQLLLLVPEESGYQLRFEYIVYTQDRLNGDLYDSFDVNVNVSPFSAPNILILRTGNGNAPATCSHYHEVDTPPGNFSLDPTIYGANASIRVRFENWSRYDGYYNTYTDLKKVWVEKDTTP